MRRNKKQQLISIINTIEKAQNRISGFIKKRNMDAVLQILTGCQEAAIEVGTALEEEKLDTIVEKLEEYCEEIYQLSVLCSQAQETRQGIQLINGIISDVRNLIEQEQGYKEIVFLPYKASMWDSLESVWLAAKEDPDCICRVIPIPYYEKLENGNRGEIICEKDLFSTKISVENYKDFDLEALNPDVIFIHNPYDDSNYVTSVTEEYYSSKLREYTDCMVYVPYYVTSNAIKPENCVLPGVIYSDFTMVQSELVKELYIKHLTEAFKENKEFLLSLNLDKKILALGSPKIDKVVNTKKEEIRLPKEWAEKVAEKKVLLYNTSVSNLLSDNENELYKMKYIFDLFLENPNIILWWRPHPLTVSTLKRLRPQLVAEYLSLVDFYRNRMVGIYDDTPDLNRALVCADGYYGDWSSLIWIFEVTGKPIMIGQAGTRRNNDYSLEIKDFVFKDEKLWFTANNVNGFFSFDLHTKETNYVGAVNGERYFQEEISHAIVKYENYLVNIPTTGKSIIRYDVEKNNFAYNSIQITPGDYYNFGAVYQVENRAYIFPYCRKELLIYDIEENKIEKSIALNKEKNDHFFSRRIFHHQDELLLVTGGDNIIYSFHLKKHKMTKKLIGNKEWKFSQIESYENKLVIVEAEGILILNDKNYAIEKEIRYPDRFSGGHIPFSDIVKIGETLYLLPENANMIVKFDMIGNTVESFIEMAEVEGKFGILNSSIHYLCAHAISKDVIYAFSKATNSMHAICINSKQVDSFKIEVKKDLGEQLRNKNLFNYEDTNNEFGLSRSFRAMETRWAPVDKLIDALEKEDIGNHEVIKNDSFFADINGTSGEKIWKYIKNK